MQLPVVRLLLVRHIQEIIAISPPFERLDRLSASDSLIADTTSLSLGNCCGTERSHDVMHTPGTRVIRHWAGEGAE